ncbi:MAG: guanylate kinase [Gammaproteobacteria bacterium]
MIGRLFVVSAPSGAGKTSLVAGLVRALDRIVVSVSHTTRAPRKSERDGVNYHFVDDATFDRMVAADEFLEHARVFDRRYGTARGWVEAQRKGGADVVLEIDWQGARQIRARAPDAIGVFVLPPTLATLRARLSGRGEDEPAVIERRMREAVLEMRHHDEYDYLIVNDDFERALADLVTVVRATRLATASQRLRLGARLQELLTGPGAG